MMMILVAFVLHSTTCFPVKPHQIRSVGYGYVKQAAITSIPMFGVAKDVIRETIDEGISSSLYVADVTQFGINTV